jgi:antitoxin (DNA-binding transcriptional repressor) of toxin-antitoxin stability system
LGAPRDERERFGRGMRELRHRTGEVLARVRRGETIDIKEYGRLIARIVPVTERAAVPVLDRLAAEGRLRPTVRPEYRPRMRAGTARTASPRRSPSCARIELTRAAIHLATAWVLGTDLTAIATYDVRLAAAAKDAGMEAIAPAKGASGAGAAGPARS